VPEADITGRNDAAQIRDVYRQMVLAWGESQQNPRRANQLFRKLQAYKLELAASAEGREAIAGLLGDPERVVRLLSATHTLSWSPERAIPVLESLATGPTLYAVDAKYTLRGYREGTLNLDWKP
jgi:hypothetical protein